MIAIASATRRFKKSHGISFQTHGSDDYDHRIRNKARRNLDRALIEEALIPEKEPYQPDEHWVVERWLQDGDKSYLDDYCVVFVSKSYEEARDFALDCDEDDFLCSLDTGYPAGPKARLMCVDLACPYSWDAREWLSYRGR